MQPLKKFWYPLQWYSSWWAGYDKVYSYWKKCIPSGKSVTLLEKKYPYQKISPSIERIFTLH